MASSIVQTLSRMFIFQHRQTGGTNYTTRLQKLVFLNSTIKFVGKYHIDNGFNGSVSIANMESGTYLQISTSSDLGRTSSVLNITDGGQNLDTRSRTSINIAIIPAAAVIIIIVIVCIKGCKWFRHYTKARRHEDEDYCSEIVIDSDEEYGYKDIASDTMSSINYDTVSSYCSMYRRGAADSSSAKAKLHRQETIRNLVFSPQKEILQCLLFEDENKENKTKNVDRINNDNNDFVRCEHGLSEYAEDTESGPLFSSFSSERRGGRFKVSFTTDQQRKGPITQTTSETILASIPRPNTYSHKPINYRLPLSTSSKNTPPSSAKTLLSSAMLVPNKHTSHCNFNQKLTMSDIGIQTEKSFIFSVSTKANKRHSSESGVDHETAPPTKLKLMDINKSDNEEVNRLPVGKQCPDFIRDSANEFACVLVEVTEQNFPQKKQHTETGSNTSSVVVTRVNSKERPCRCNKYPIEPEVVVGDKYRDEIIFTEPCVEPTDDVFVTTSANVCDTVIANNTCQTIAGNSNQYIDDYSCRFHDKRSTIPYNRSETQSFGKEACRYMQNRCQSLPCLYKIINQSQTTNIESIKNKFNFCTNKESVNNLMYDPYVCSCSKMIDQLQARNKFKNGNRSKITAEQFGLCEQCIRMHYQSHRNITNCRLFIDCYKKFHQTRENSFSSEGPNSSLTSLASSGYAENSFDLSD